MEETVVLDVKYRAPSIPNSSRELDNIEVLRDKARQIYELNGLEKQAVTLLAEHRHIRRVSALMQQDSVIVRNLIARVMARLGVKRFHELITLVRMTQVSWETSPAMSLHALVHNVLIGATIRGSVLQDTDWVGLLVDMPSGAQRVMWLYGDAEGSNSFVFVELE